MSFAVSDAVTQVLHAALDGVSLRQRVTADNIANVDTPNFRATTVAFEDALRSAVDDGTATTRPVSATTMPTNTPVGLNGNNVDLRKETLAAVQSGFQYQMLSRAVSDKFELMRTSAGSF